MKHHKVLAAVVLIAGAVTLGGCNDDKPTTTTPLPAKTNVSPSPSLPATPPTYTMPANVCTAVKADAFADLVPAAPQRTSEMGRGKTARHTSSTCVVTLGTLDKAVLVSVGVDLFNDSFGAQGQYEGLRGVAFKDYPGAHDVTGVGSAAYFFSDPDLGPHLVVQSGNAHIGISAVAIDDDNPLPADVEKRLIAVAHATLSKLPTA